MAKRTLSITLLLVVMLYVSPLLLVNRGISDTMYETIPNSVEQTYTESAHVLESESDFIDLGASGEGTVDNPFIIEGKVFSSTTTCIIIKDIESYFIIRNCQFTSPYGSNGYGIHLSNASNGVIQSCRFSSKVSGIFLYKATNTSMERLTITDCLYYGIDSFYSDYCNITDCTINDNDGAGVVTYRSNHWRFQNTTLNHNGDYGINMHMSTYCTVINCTISNTRGYGTIFTNAHYSVVNDTNLVDNHGRGSWLQITNYMEFNHCNISGNSAEGINGYNSQGNVFNFIEMKGNRDAFRLGGCSGWKILNCLLINNGVGIAAGSQSNWNHDFTNSTIDGKPILLLNGEANQTINGIDYSQIVLLNCENITILGGEYHGTSMGIAMAYSSNCSAQNAIAKDLTYSGFMIRESTNCALSNCSVVRCAGGGIIIIDADYSIVEKCEVANCSSWGVWSLRGDSTTFTDNTFSNNVDYGAYLQETQLNNFTNNVFEGNGVYMEWYWNEFFENNSINGKTLAYYWNLSNTAIDASDCGQIILANCNNVTISNAVLGGYAYPIQISSCTDCNIENVAIHQSLEYGVLFYDSQSCHLVNCNVSSVYGAGVEIAYSSDCGLVGCRLETIENHGLYSYISTNTTLIDNEFHGCGPFIDGSDDEDFTLTCMGNYVNSKPFGAFFGMVGGSIDGSSYGQVLLGNCTDVTVNSITVSNSSIGIQIGASDGCQIVDGNITACTVSAVDIRRSTHCSLVASHIWNNTGTGIHIAGMDTYSTVSLCTVEENYEFGIHLDDADYALVEHNVLRYNLKGGLYIELSTYANALSNEIYGNNEFGINWFAPYLSTASDNIVINNTGQGITILSGSNSTFSSNLVSNNENGILLQGSSYNTLTDNEFTYNEGVGCFIAMAKGNSLFDNLLAWNDEGNAIDYGYMYEEADQTTWDDFDWRGNTWSDYNGTGWYHIPGHAESVDHFPERADVISPTINAPSDLQYEGGTSNNQITWSPIDEHPLLYRVYCNGILVSSSIWIGSDITINVDGLSPGMYTYVLWVYDTCYNAMKDSVIVTVTDTTKPTIDSPSDVVLELGSVGNTISWVPHDAYPSHFEVLLDSLSYDTGLWDTQNISVSIDGLSLGFHNLTLVVYDVGSNSVSDSVMVTIEDTTSPTISSPSDISFVEGVQGEVIIWTASDYLPNSYTLYRNDSVLSSGSWTNGNFIIPLDNLHVGIYNYTLSVDDTQGNTASDTVLVIVVSTHTSTTTTASSTTTSVSTSTPTTGTIVMDSILIGAAAGLGVIVGILSTAALYRSGRIRVKG